MNIYIYMLLAISILFSKERVVPKMKINRANQLRSINGIINNSTNLSSSNRTSRDDTSTVWFEDFEGDVSGWTINGEGWALSQSSYNSSANSFNVNDDVETYSDLISPVISLPEIASSGEIYKVNFALWCDLPDADGNADDYLDDYYWLEMANLTENPVYFSPNSTNGFEGNSWWCADETLGGYLDGWIQFLDTPAISIDAGGYTLSAMMKWGIEDFSGAAIDGSCADGWDVANVRVSADDGETWDLLTGSDPYDFSCGYGWIYNNVEYETGGSLNSLSSGWGGTVDWHEVTFDLSAYVGEDVIIRFAFGSDPSVTDAGLQVDNIEVLSNSGTRVFYDNADDEIAMIPNNGGGLTWTRLFYDYGDISRPGASGWAVYQPGEPFNGNIQLDISDYAGSDIQLRFTGYMDEDIDGGDGEGLYIDDVHIWKIEVNELPLVQNLSINSGDANISLDWDMPPSGSLADADIFYDDGGFEDAINLTEGTAIAGTLFDMPYGAESVVVNKVYVTASVASGDGSSTLYGYNVVNGFPESSPLYEASITLGAGWVEFDTNWSFDGDYMIGLQINEEIAIELDLNSSPSSASWIDNAGWVTWSEVAGENGLEDGEWAIRSNVTTTGLDLTPTFNVYRSTNGGELVLMFNGSAIEVSEYNDNLVQNGVEYCYGITSVYGQDESEFSSILCATPEPQTIYEMSMDDGTDETSTNVGANNFVAVKFTPNSYPVDLYKAKIYSVGSNTGVVFLSIWTEDLNGLPGEAMLSNIALNLNLGWNEQDLSGFGITVESGSFFIGYQEMPGAPAIGVDSDSPSDPSYLDLGIGIGWEPFSNYFDGALMVRAEVDSANSVTASAKSDLVDIPSEFGLSQNYPNPFNPYTMIEFGLAKSSRVDLSIYNMLGKKVQTVVNNSLSAGFYKFGVYANSLPSGMYLYRLEAKDNSGKILHASSKKLVLLK